MTLIILTSLVVLTLVVGWLFTLVACLTWAALTLVVWVIARLGQLARSWSPRHHTSGRHTRELQKRSE